MNKNLLKKLISNIEVTESLETPLSLFKIQVHRKDFEKLLFKISDGREINLSTIIFCGGFRYRPVGNDNDLLIPIEKAVRDFEKLPDELDIIHGTYSHQTKDVNIFLETSLFSHCYINGDLEITAQIKDVILDNIYDAILEELEHSFQDINDSKYFLTESIQWMYVLRRIVTFSLMFLASVVFLSSYYAVPIPWFLLLIAFSAIVGFFFVNALFKVNWPDFMKRVFYKVSLVEREAKQRKENTISKKLVKKAFSITFIDI